MKPRSYLDKYLRPLLYACCVVFLMPACIIVVEEDDDDDEYYRRRWELELIVYSSNTYAPRDGDVYTITFENTDVFSGRADCVQFNGDYEVGRTSTLSIKNLNAGSQACGVDSIADMYLDELASARSVSGNADELIIHLDGENNLMRFRPQ